MRASRRCAKRPLTVEGVIPTATPRRASRVLVGEQPGDQEDRQDRPFVGPAGRLLDQALQEAGIPREALYVTYAVKHSIGLPAASGGCISAREGEIDACVPWLMAVAQVIRPQAVVCPGATAARAAFGRAVRLKDVRGRFSATPLADRTFVRNRSPLGPYCGSTRRSVTTNTAV